jgi:hypothetical protein
MPDDVAAYPFARFVAQTKMFRRPVSEGCSLVVLLALGDLGYTQVV